LVQGKSKFSSELTAGDGYIWGKKSDQVVSLSI